MINAHIVGATAIPHRMLLRGFTVAAYVRLYVRFILMDELNQEQILINNHKHYQ